MPPFLYFYYYINVEIKIIKKETVGILKKDFPLLKVHLEKRESNIFYQEYSDIVFYMGAFIDGGIIGIVGFESIVSDKKEFLYLSPLEVIAPYKKKGVASALVQEVLKKAKDNNLDGVLLICSGELVSFYKRNGFQTELIYKEGDKNKFLMKYLI